MKKFCRKAKPLGLERLEEIALHYVGRYAATRTMLERTLQNHVMRAARLGDGPDDNVAKKWIAEISAKAVSKGWVNDQSYAEALIRGARRAGWSRYKIAQKLASKGVCEDIARELPGGSDEDEEQAALALAKRKGLGPWRKNKNADPRKEMEKLCRAGFSPSLARKVVKLSYPPEEGD